MGLWVLEPDTDEPVPGTVHVSRETEAERHLTRHLKHGTGRHANLVLVPQPSDSPNDPLNWPQWQKHYMTVYLSIGTGIMSGTLNFVNPSNKAYAKFLHTTVSNLSRSISVMLLCVGLSVVLFSPAARIWGKRPVLLASNIVAIIGYAIVLSDIQSIHHLYAGRAIHGLGLAGLEYLVTSTIGDLFFVHERGYHIAFWHFGLQAGNSCGQVIGAQIVAAQSWYWAFTYAVIITSVYTVIFFFTCPETSYIRSSKLNTDIHESLDGDDSAADEAGGGGPGADGKTAEARVTDVEKQEQTTSSTAAAPEAKRPYRATLRVYNGRFTDDSLLRSMVAPFSVYMLPAVVWSTYTVGCSIGFAASFSVSLSSIFGGAPYHFTTRQVGLTVLSSFVGGSLGNMVPGPVLDWLVRVLARRNGGVYEPEFRNVLAVPGLVLGLGGFWGFGLSLHYACHWMVPVFFYGLATFAGAIMTLVSNTYLLDCHRAQAQEGYAATTFGRSVFSFVMTFVISDWIQRDGIVTVFFVVGALHGVGGVMGIVLYFYGKRVSETRTRRTTEDEDEDEDDEDDVANRQIRYAVHKSAFIQRHLGTVRTRD